MNEPNGDLAANIHLRALLVDLVMKARMIDDPCALDQLIAETEKKAERAARLKDEWLNAEQLVERYPGIFETVNVVRNHVARGTGPRFVKFGKHRQSPVRWKVADVEAWILEQQGLTGFANQSYSSSGGGSEA